MLKYVYIAAFTFVSLALNAQINAGSKSLGGQLFLNLDADKNTFNDTLSLEGNYFSFGFNPSFSYFISDEWAIGGFLSYGHSKSTNEGYGGPVAGIQESTSSENRYGLGFFVQRYYKLSRSLYFRTQLAASARFRENEWRAPNREPSRSKSREVSSAISPGFSYFVNRDLALTLDWTALRYTYRDPGNSDRTSHDIDFRLNMSAVGFGLEWFF